MSYCRNYNSLALIIAGFILLNLPCLVRGQSDYRSPKVEALLKPLGPANSALVYTPKKSTKAYKNMEQRLKNADTTVLKLLMEEVANIGFLQQTQHSLAPTTAYRTYRLYEAFQIVGTNATPIFSQLTNEFVSGKSAWGAGCGLMAVGEKGWLVLIQGLTNSNAKVQLAALDAMHHAQRTDAILAFPHLAQLATNSFVSHTIRREAEHSMVGLDVNPQMKIPVLLNIAETATNVFDKLAAIAAFKLNNITNAEVLSFLEQASHDENKRVRHTSIMVLKELKEDAH